MNLRAALFLSTAIATAAFGAAPVRDPNQTDLKIRLMAEALTARDAGDFVGAKQKLEALTQIVPNDPGVRRLIADLDVKEADRLARLASPPPSPPPIDQAIQPPSQQGIVANADGASTSANSADSRPNGLVPISPPARSTANSNSAPGVALSSTAAPRNPTPGRTEAVEQVAGIPVIVEGHAPGPAGPPDRYAEALANVEKEGVAFARAGDDQLEKLMTYVQAQRALARVYARDRNYAAATATLAEAQSSLESSLDEIRSEKRDYILREVEAREAKQGVRLRHRR